jgi:hypothetical protein
MVPVKAARALWEMVRQSRESNSGITSAVAVGDFMLREIRADGTCVVGCHTLDYAETSRFAAAQGWTV